MSVYMQNHKGIEYHLSKYSKSSSKELKVLNVPRVPNILGSTPKQSTTSKSSFYHYSNLFYDIPLLSF